MVCIHLALGPGVCFSVRPGASVFFFGGGGGGGGGIRPLNVASGTDVSKTKFYFYALYNH